MVIADLSWPAWELLSPLSLLFTLFPNRGSLLAASAAGGITWNVGEARMVRLTPGFGGHKLRGEAQGSVF